jgi:hypothetical protein
MSILMTYVFNAAHLGLYDTERVKASVPFLHRSQPLISDQVLVTLNKKLLYCPTQWSVSGQQQ